MKISTKFIGISVVLVGAIAVISGASTGWRNHIEYISHEKYNQSQRRIRLATLAQQQLHAEVLELKDHILFRDIEEEDEEESDKGLEGTLDELESLTSASEVKYIRERHEIFERLEENLIEAINQGENTTLKESRFDFRAVNGFAHDIDFFLDKLAEQAQKQAEQTERDIQQVDAIATTISYVTIGLLILMVLAVFWLVLRPMIQSLEQLQKGAKEIGAGNLSHRMVIHTQDEIEQLSQAFNRMAESLGNSQANLQQKLEEIEIARTAAETANRSKSEFLANMNHELRTPLNGILGYAQIIERDPATTDKQMKGVRVIHQCASHLLTLINDILDLSKLEAQKMELYPQDFHFVNFLSSTADICRIKAEQKGVEFNFQPGANLPTAVNADDKRLRQVLLNLLSNAVKFTDYGSVSFRIELVNPIEPQSKILRIRFQVKDTGIGIAPEKIASVFLPFEQAGKRERNIEGTGLGLAISQQIVEKMGSSIQIESVFGKGSCFWFEIDLPLASEWTDGQAIVNQRVIGYHGEQRKILVVDDREENCLVVINMLEPLGFEVEQAENGHKGLDIALNTQPDLIITDVHMSGMDGLEMTRLLRQRPEFAQTPIIASPATLSQVDMQDSLDAGCNSFFPKPLELNGLLAEVQRLLNLEWISETTSDTNVSDENCDSAQDEIIFPPSEQLVLLYTAVQGGFISDVQQEANRLKQLEPKYIPFANKVLELSQQFDDEGILKLLASQM